MSRATLSVDHSLDDFREYLVRAAGEAGLLLDFLMKTWNGRFATYNVGRPDAAGHDPRQGVRGEARHYKLIGRVKATTREGAVHVTLVPPTGCDPDATPEDESLWEEFVVALHETLGLGRAVG